MIKKGVAIFILFLFLLTNMGVVAQAEDNRLLFQFDANYPPFDYVKGNELYGFAVDFAQNIFHESPYELICSGDTWNDVYSRIKAGSIDSCGLIAVLPDRGQDLLYTVPVLKSHIAIYTRSKFEEVTLERLSNYRIGVGKSNYPESVLSAQLGITNYISFGNVEDCVQALATGRIDVIFEDEQVVNYYLVKNGLKGNIVPQLTSLYPVNVAFGVKTSRPELVAFMNKRIRELQKSGVYETLYVNHFFQNSDYYARNRTVKILVSIVIVAIIALLIIITMNTYIKSLRSKLQNAYNQLQKQHDWVNAAYNIASATNNSNDIPALIHSIHQSLSTIINTKNFYIALYDPHQETMHFPYLIDETMPENGYADTPSRKYGNGITEYVIKTDQTLLLSDRDIDEMGKRGDISIIGHIPVSWLGTPLKIDNQPMGIIAVQSYSKEIIYTQEDMELLKFASNQVAVAIHRKRFEETINHMAFFDALTDMPNRVLFNDRLNQALIQARQNKNLLAVLFLDLDHFKTINDSLGHGLGDKLLQEVSQRLMNILREDDTIARLGGDEFTILLPQLHSAEDAALLAEKIIDTLAAPFYIDGIELIITVSIGISVFPMDGEDAETLIKNADTALYRAKENGRNSYELYTATMNATVFKRFSLDNKLRHAIKNGELEVYYQPQVDIISGGITGIEALIRWNHPDLGLIPPSDFIPIAEESGLIVLIDEFVMETACKKNKALHEAGFHDLKVSVNISARHFKNMNLLDTVKKILKQTGLPPRYLELELTEGTLMQDVDYTLSLLNNLKHLGVNIALDDFGTGYSSLGYLKSFPIDTLKIDRSFINNVNSDKSNAMITSAVIALAQSLRHKTIAEGVETMEELSFLTEHKCDHIQGYLFSRPVSSSQLDELLQTYIFLKM